MNNFNGGSKFERGGRKREPPTDERPHSVIATKISDARDGRLIAGSGLSALIVVEPAFEVSIGASAGPLRSATHSATLL